MVAFEAIINAVLTPMTTVEFWYGVFLTLGFRKEIREIVVGFFDHLKKLRGSGGDPA